MPNVKPLAFLAVSTAGVLALLQACSANPHPDPLPDCVATDCTINKVPPQPQQDGTVLDTSTAPDTSVADTSVADTSVADAATDG